MKNEHSSTTTSTDCTAYGRENYCDISLNSVQVAYYTQWCVDRRTHTVSLTNSAWL